MKKIALLDNLGNINNFLNNKYEEATASDILDITGGNTGNVAFVYAIKKLLGNKSTRINWGSDAEYVRSNFDQIVICAANQIGEHVDLKNWADILKAFDLPVTVIGIGAQADNYNTEIEIPVGTVEFLKTVDHYKIGHTNMAVRGSFTESTLKTIDIESTVTGCPSLLIADENLEKRIYENNRREFTKVAVSSGNLHHVLNRDLEYKMIEVADEYNGAYVLQHPELMLKLGLSEVEDLSEDEKKMAIEALKFNNLSKLNDWMHHHSILFIDAPNWMRYLRRFDVAIGARYHGVALAIQSGIPGMVVTIDSRTKELSEETGVKNCKISDIESMTPGEIVDMSRWTDDEMSNFIKNRYEKIKIFQKFFMDNDLTPSEHFIKLINTCK